MAIRDFLAFRPKLSNDSLSSCRPFEACRIRATLRPQQEAFETETGWWAMLDSNQ
jgi:hypothetical protein